MGVGARCRFFTNTAHTLQINTNAHTHSLKQTNNSMQFNSTLFPFYNPLITPISGIGYHWQLKRTTFPGFFVKSSEMNEYYIIVQYGNSLFTGSGWLFFFTTYNRSHAPKLCPKNKQTQYMSSPRIARRTLVCWPATVARRPTSGRGGARRSGGSSSPAASTSATAVATTAAMSPPSWLGWIPSPRLQQKKKIKWNNHLHNKWAES